jgi:predicted AAA+ superfamily ATPase
MDPDALAIGAMSGAILETWILSELLKGYWHTGKSAPFYFYRDKDQKEIDLLIVQDGAVYPLEFKKTASPRRDDVRHFQVLKKLGMPVGPGGLICLAEKSLPLGQDVLSIPVSAL